ncbi:MAG: glycosyltransferase family 39 protein [Planctomycetia bacterium]|nr:glycosyltransferase family 39 protein [Planctomycetia bacterium]
MFQKPVHPLVVTLCLIVLGLGLYLPGLGVPSLWDIDEGHNAQAAREMLEAGTWITPTFNYQLRVDKPALLYWLQMCGYLTLGIDEFSARLPSALAAVVTVLLTYFLGRRCFDPGTALLGAIVLATSLLFSGSAHFANPDALLNACNVLTFLLFWIGWQDGHARWLGWVGISTGIGFLAKGPVAVVLPASVVILFLLWTRQLRRLFSPRILLGWMLFALVAIPWFALVGSETKGEYLRGFFLKHNRDRFLAPMEGHSGPIIYHVGSLLLGFLPWSVFLGPTLWCVWQAWRKSRTASAEAPNSTPNESMPGESKRDLVPAMQFLACWIAVYFVFFSISRTKLPNYILPIYPPVALLTAWFLEGWRRGELNVPRWLMNLSLACWALVGVGTSIGLVVAGGVFNLAVLKGRSMPGLENGVFLGLLPVLGAAAAWLCWKRQATVGMLGSLTVSAALFVFSLMTWGAATLDMHKAPRTLVTQADARQLDREVRIGCYGWYQPSLVFYCEREVQQLLSEQQVLEFLRSPLEVYLFVPVQIWEGLEAKVHGPCRPLARQRCLYRNCEVMVVSNR